MQHAQRGGFDSRADELERQRGCPVRRALLLSFAIAAGFLLWANGAFGVEAPIAKLPAPAKTEAIPSPQNLEIKESGVSLCTGLCRFGLMFGNTEQNAAKKRQEEGAKK